MARQDTSTGAEDDRRRDLQIARLMSKVGLVRKLRP